MIIHDSVIDAAFRAFFPISCERNPMNELERELIGEAAGKILLAYFEQEKEMQVDLLSRVEKEMGEFRATQVELSKTIDGMYHELKKLKSEINEQ